MSSFRWPAGRRTLIALLGLVAIVAGMRPGALLAQPTAPVEARRPADWRLLRQPVQARKPIPAIPLLIERLSSPKFAERAAATRDLARGGMAAVPVLRDAVVSDRPETAIRALSALENLWLRAMENEEDQLADAALTALGDLSTSNDPAVAHRIESLMAVYRTVIEKVAVAEVKRFGGVVRHLEGVMIADEDGYRPQIQHIVIGASWTGGEDELRHLRRIRSGGRLGVYFIKDTSLSDEAIKRFNATAPPHLSVQVRGASYLGVKSNNFVQGVQGCLVESAEPNTPAEKAGVQPGDVFVEFAGRPIRSFDDLVDAIKVTKPGQTIDAIVLRGGERSPLKITMEEWK